MLDRIWSHASHYWHILLILLIGALGNAVLALVVPVTTGRAFNAMLQPVPDTSVLLPLALIIGGTQILRGVLQFGRNFGAELMAQKMERDIRDELYLSLLGKSMTFHNLQPVGDTMARSTNDVREVNYMFSPGVNLVVGSFMFILMPLFFGPRYHPSLVLTPLVFIIIYFVALARYLKSLSPVTDMARATFGQGPPCLLLCCGGFDMTPNPLSGSWPIPYIPDPSGFALEAFVSFCVAVLLAGLVHAEAQAFASTLLGDRRAGAKDRFHFIAFWHLDIIGSICFLVGGFGWPRLMDVNPARCKLPWLYTLISRLSGPVANLLLANIAASLVSLLGKLEVDARVFNMVLGVNVTMAVYNLVPWSSRWWTSRSSWTSWWCW